MNKRKAIQYLINKRGKPLPGMRKLLIELATERINKIHNYLAFRADRTEKLCSNCQEKHGRKHCAAYLYDTPWEDKPHERFFCSEECQESYLHDGDFSYFICEFCEREICQQNPANGWHSQYRILDEMQICLKCYEEHVLENGVSREEIERGKLPGMFFSYGNTEPKDKGYEEVHSNLFIRSEESVKDARNKILALMDKGKKVVVAYERMAIGGIEGSISILAKEVKKDDKRGNRKEV